MQVRRQKEALRPESPPPAAPATAEPLPAGATGPNIGTALLARARPFFPHPGEGTP